MTFEELRDSKSQTWWVNITPVQAAEFAWEASRLAAMQECAKVCNMRANRSNSSRGGMGQIFAETQDEEARQCAAAIRARAASEPSK